MAVHLNQVFFPSTYADLFSAWNRFPHAVPYAGGTGLIRDQGGQVLELPSVILSLDELDEMHRISRTERYLEIGAMVSLNRIIDMGKIVPCVFRFCLEAIAGPQLRNMATLGGNICMTERQTDCPAALTALDAQYELRGGQSSRWISASRFNPGPEGVAGPESTAGAERAPCPTSLNPGELLTRIRVPLDNWDYSAYKKFTGYINRGRSVVFLAKTQKDTLSDIRVVYKADAIFRNKNIESVLIGKQLPLSQKIAGEFIAQWGKFLSEIHGGNPSGNEILNYIEMNVYNLSE